MDLKQTLKSFIPVPGFLTYSMLVIQLLYFVIFVNRAVPGYSMNPAGIMSMLFGFVTLLFLATGLELLVVSIPVRRMITPVILFFQWALNSYHLSAGSSLDFALVRDNIGISFSPEALSTISSPFGKDDLLTLCAILAVWIILEARFTIMLRRGKGGITSLIIWTILVLIPVNAGDGFTLFAKSAIAKSPVQTVKETVSAEYPFERDYIPETGIRSSVPSSKKDRPNVFLILIESFNANFVVAKAPDGIDYTPNFNSLIKTGLYFDRFYGNSIQTCKGQAAVFFSILPSIKGKLFVDYPHLNIEGFPALLAENGYHTVYFQAYYNLKFDNTGSSMKKAGFSVVKTYKEFRRKEDNPHIWGWGIEDGIFYERFFEMLDSEHGKNPGKPVFASLCTVGTHIPCDGMPVEERKIYKDPKNIKEKYSNALRLSDSQLPRFFELLKKRKYLDNSIVIITADHSFPMREHGIYNNEVCFYDETFRIPFLLIWDGVIKPERIKDRAYSQIDIGPTIADLVGITKGRNTMTGFSVFDRKRQHPVYLIQPYNGCFLQVVDYPLKYIKHIRTGKEYLFNLAADPMEKVNLMLQGFEPETVNKLKGSLKTVYLNQQLIEQDRFRRK